MIKIRQPQVAGAFYPADKTELQDQLGQFLTLNEKIENDQMVKLLVVPHAGYIYSGSVAAVGFKQVEGKNVDRVILLGPSHQSWFEGVAIDENDLWETPLGKVKVDKEFSQKLIDPENKINFNSSVHQAEHCLEVEIPFLQTIFKNFKIIPLLFGNTNNQTIEKLASLIAKNLEQNTLVVISSDLSHYPNYDIANLVDQKTIRSILSGDPEKFEKSIQEEMAIGYPSLETCACGEKAIKTAMLIAQKLKGRWQLIKYQNSGDITGDKSRVVGYAALKFSIKK